MNVHKQFLALLSTLSDEEVEKIGVFSAIGVKLTGKPNGWLLLKPLITEHLAFLCDQTEMTMREVAAYLKDRPSLLWGTSDEKLY